MSTYLGTGFSITILGSVVTISLHSVSRCIAQLKQGEAAAAQSLWQRYAARLVEFARQRLGSAPRRAADEEDVALSVFDTICRGASQGRFQELTNRDELWWLLMTITRRKVVDYVRREAAQKRGGPQVLENGQPAAIEPLATDGDLSFDELVGPDPTPDFLVMLAEEHERLLGLLRDDCLRQIATARIEGYTVSEIADKLGIARRAVERKLRLVRAKWAKELFDTGPPP